MEFELNDFLNGLFCRKDIKIKQPINSNTIAEAVNEYLKNKQASPHSMPSVEQFNQALKKEYNSRDNGDFDTYKKGFGDCANWMRSQCEGLIKQKDEEIKRLIERIPTCNLTKD